MEEMEIIGFEYGLFVVLIGFIDGFVEGMSEREELKMMFKFLV